MGAVVLAGAGCGTAAVCARAESPYVELDALRVGDIVHVPTGRAMTRGEALDWLAAFRVVFVGETHDSPSDHAIERIVLEGLAARHGGRVALGLEMLPQTDQPTLDAYLRGEVDDAAMQALWERRWGPTWAQYRPLLALARRLGIPVVALNCPRDVVQAVVAKGLDGLDPETAARLPAMDRDDPWHRTLARAVFEAHARGSGRFDRFEAVQALWDEAMADTAARFLRGPGRDRTLVVVAGAFHVRHGVGIPRRLFRRLPVPYATVVPIAVRVAPEREQALMETAEVHVPLPVADLVWAVGYGDAPEIGAPERPRATTPAAHR